MLRRRAGGVALLGVGHLLGEPAGVEAVQLVLTDQVALEPAGQGELVLDHLPDTLGQSDGDQRVITFAVDEGAHVQTSCLALILRPVAVVLR